MSGRRGAAYAVAVLCGLCLAIALSLIRSGLPSHARLAAVGGAPRPAPEEVARMVGDWSEIRSAGGATNSFLLARKDRPGVSDRLRVMRRMILYTTEPDELQTLLAFGRMNPRRLDFNPHFFQYGGVFLYGAAATTALGAAAGYLNLPKGLADLLTDPEKPARIYVAARLWVVLWSALLPLVVYRLARNLLDRPAALAAAACGIWVPGFFQYAAILKPQSILTVLGIELLNRTFHAARRGATRDWMRAGVVWGLLAGTSLPHAALGAGLLYLVGIRLRRPGDALRAAAVLAVAAALAFLFTNPYWLLDPAGVVADFRAAARWYRPEPTLENITRVLAAVPPMTSTWAVGVGLPLCAALAAAPRAVLGPVLEGSGARASALAILVWFGAIGYRMTGVAEISPMWGRHFFALLPATLIFLLAAVRGRTAKRPRLGAALVAVLAAAALASTLPRTLVVLRNHWIESTTSSTRFAAGRWIEANVPAGIPIATSVTPSPASLPFFSLTRHASREVRSPDEVERGEWLAVVSRTHDTWGDLRGDGFERVRVFPAVHTLRGVRVWSYEEEFNFSNPTITLWRKR